MSDSMSGSDLAARVVDALPNTICAIDQAGVIVFVNEAWRRFGILGGAPRDASIGVGANYFNCCRTSPDDDSSSQAVAGIRAVLARETDIFEFEYPCHSPSQDRWFMMRAVAIDLPENGPGAAIMHIDITSRRLAEERVERMNTELERMVDKRTAELRAAVEELQKLDQVKSRFISTVSHDLKTPLTSIYGFIKLIRRDLNKHCPADHFGDCGLAPVRTRIMDNIDIISAETDRLTRLINDFLDLSRIENQAAVWNDVETNLCDMISKIYNMFSTQAVDSGLSFRINCPGNLPRLRIDPDRVSQVIYNLVGNAFKFTEEGGLALTAHEAADGVVVSVTDTGPGLSPQDIPHVFDKFYQAGSDTLPHTNKGTGLGLTICREIVQHYGGTIWVESTPQEGSTFSFKLPSALIV
jgi:signal transduction histidine kinase